MTFDLDLWPSDRMNIRRLPYYINKPSLVQIGDVVSTTILQTIYVCTLETSALTTLKFDRAATKLQEEYSELETHIDLLDDFYNLTRKVEVKWKSTSI